MAARRTLALALAFFCMAALSACVSSGPPKPKIKFNDSFDFTAIKQLVFAAEKTPVVGKPALTKAQSARFHRGLELALKNRGFEVTGDKTQAQLIVHWEMQIQEKINTRSYDFLGYVRCWRCGPSKSDVSMQDYTEGIFTVDMMEPRLKKSVWRGVMQARIEPDMKELEEASLIEAACERMLSSFPPPPRSSIFSGLLKK
jgi:hypothetical protein